MSKSGQKALPDVREWSGVPPKSPEVVEMHSGSLGVVRRPSRMSWSGREALQMSGSGREAHPEVPG